MPGWPLWPAAPRSRRGRPALLRPGPVLVGEVGALADHDLGAVRRRAARVGQAHAVELQHVLAVGPVRPGLRGVAVAGPDHQLGTGTTLAGVVEALAEDRQGTSGEGPLLGWGVVARPDVHLVAVSGTGPKVVEALTVVTRDRLAGEVDRPVERHRLLGARLVLGGHGDAGRARGGGRAGDGAG